MNFNNFTIKSQEVIQQAVDITRRGGNQAIEPATIAKAILQQGDSLIAASSTSLALLER